MDIHPSQLPNLLDIMTRERMGFELQRLWAIERYAALILELYEKTPDVTLAELKAELAERGVATGMTTIWRFFQRRKITLKKRPRTRRSRTAQIS